ncbi:hypothetical protein ACFL4G_03090 [Thermodesulfobacteriota bacterium]
MKMINYKANIDLYYETNPRLSHEDLAVLLTAELLYQDLPEDLTEFRRKYTHLDPDVLQKPSDGITFLKMAASDEDAARIRDRLNAYMNIKFHDIVHSKEYEGNAAIFQKHSMTASRIIDEILEKSALPPPLIEVLRERNEVQSCHDFFEMLMLYRNTKSRRVKYEVMRKLGLIVLISRINRGVEIEKLENRMKQVWEALNRGLGATSEARREYYLWLNAEQRIEYEMDRKKAETEYQKEMENRWRRAYGIYPLEKIICHSFLTFSGNKIIHMEIRNKFGSTEDPTYTSYAEKMLRKNLEFPNQIHDTIGVKIVVSTEEEIPPIISDLESFLGGSSTRKMEKNSYHLFGRQGMSEYSSNEYFVWKAIYDITLPHPSITQIERMLEITRNTKRAQEELTKQLQYFVNNPRDFVIEVQLQDIKSYLLSMAKGSPTEHARLKISQIRSNSFYKFFPKEIFQEEINRLKEKILNREKTER